MLEVNYTLNAEISFAVVDVSILLTISWSRNGDMTVKMNFSTGALITEGAACSKWAESGRGKPCSLLVRLVFTPYLLNAALLRKLPFLKSSQCGTELVGITFWPPCCA